jgi:hypothetical protein
MNTVLLETWTESERGWGQRSDGCSLHKNKDDYQKYVEKYWEGMPSETPDEYSRPDKNLREVVVSDELFEQVSSSDNGIRLWQSEFRSKREKHEILFTD